MKAAIVSITKDQKSTLKTKGLIIVHKIQGKLACDA